MLRVLKNIRNAFETKEDRKCGNIETFSEPLHIIQLKCQIFADIQTQLYEKMSLKSEIS